jgi:polysaccharide biosynthesis/export protein
MPQWRYRSFVPLPSRCVVRARRSVVECGVPLVRRTPPALLKRQKACRAGIPVSGTWEWHRHMLFDISRARASARQRLIGACLTVASAIVSPTLAAIPAVAQGGEVYRIAIGDKVSVLVLGEPDLSAESIVDQNGSLRLPLVGDVRAADLTLGQLERSIGASLEAGYTRRSTVAARITEFRPIYVLGTVRTSGPFPYRAGETVLAAIARAGGLGSADHAGTDVFQVEERVRLLELARVALVTKRARLVTQQRGGQRIEFPSLSGVTVDAARIAEVRDAEERTFLVEQQAEQQEADALRKQFPRLEGEIAAIKEQRDLELRQRDLNQQLIADYEQLNKAGLARKPTYIEIRREEARIESNMARLKSESLKAELAIGDLQFRIAELHNTYQRRVMTELRETDRSLLELSVTLPAARRALHARQAGLTGGDEGAPKITVLRSRGAASSRLQATFDFVLQPGDVVQVDAPAAELRGAVGTLSERKAGNTGSAGSGDPPAPRVPAALQSAASLPAQSE